MIKKKWLGIPALLVVALVSVAADSDCDTQSNKADKQQTVQQNALLEEANKQVGMPNITHFQEKRFLKLILEMRDKEGLATITYTYSEQTGRLRKFCDSVGYGFPYATQFTSPQKPIDPDYHDSAVIAQADPNGLFSPTAADGTWVMCQNPAKRDEVLPLYVEPHVVVSPFPLPQAE